MSTLYEQGTPHADGYRDVDVPAVVAEKERVRMVDVREPSEFDAVLGHIEGAELVPLGTVMEAAEAWPKEEELLLVCRSGGRSGQAAGQLARKGFTRLMNLRGGMLAWNEAGLPVVREGQAAPSVEMMDVLDTLLTRLRELGGNLSAATMRGLLEPHGSQPTWAQLLALLELLQSTGQVAARDQAAFERTLRECRDLLSVAHRKAGAA